MVMFDLTGRPDHDMMRIGTLYEYCLESCKYINDILGETR